MRAHWVPLPEAGAPEIMMRGADVAEAGSVVEDEADAAEDEGGVWMGRRARWVRRGRGRVVARKLVVRNDVDVRALERDVAVKGDAAAEETTDRKAGSIVKTGAMGRRKRVKSEAGSVPQN